MKLLLILLASFSAAVAVGQAPNNISWYKKLSGSIDKYPVTIHLHKAGHYYTGFYYYNSQQQLLYFTGEDTMRQDSVHLTIFAGRDKDEELTFRLSNNAANGKWKMAEGDKTLLFTAKEVTDSPIAFQYVYSSGTAVLRPSWKDSPGAEFTIGTVWPAGNSTVEREIKSFIRLRIPENDTPGDIGAVFLKNKRDNLSLYLKEHQNAKDADIKASPYIYQQDETSHHLIAYQSKNWLTLAQYLYAYTGGAHGNYGTTYLVLNLQTGKMLTLKDVLTASGIKALPALLNKAFKKSNGLGSGDPLTEGGLFEDKLPVSDNFYITSKGIGFSYTPYEVGPYALGQVTVFVPFTELQHYLQPSFTKLLEP